MKRLLVLFVMVLAIFLSGCEKKADAVSLYEGALSLKSDEFILREDGTVWFITEMNGTMEYFGEYDGKLSSEVKKESSEEMELWEFALACRADKRVGICKDGSVWIFPYAGSDDRSDGYAFKAEPVGEIVPHDGFWIETREIGVNPHYAERGEPHPVIFWTLHDDSGELYNLLKVDLEVLIDGQWYFAAGYSGETLAINYFGENGEYRGITPLVTGLEVGYENTQTVPSGHYRLRAKAYHRDARDEDGKHHWEEKYLRHAAAEFDLIYKNGEYKIKNIKN